MAKITIQGETFEFDGNKKPMLEMMELEKQSGMRYGEYEQELAAGSIKAIATFVWQVWYRDGRNIPLSDILEMDLDLGDLFESLEAIGAEAAAEAEAKENPTGTARSPSTGTSTSRSSRSTTTSGRGK